MGGAEVEQTHPIHYFLQDQQYVEGSSFKGYIIVAVYVCTYSSYIDNSNHSIRNYTYVCQKEHTHHGFHLQDKQILHESYI